MRFIDEITRFPMLAIVSVKTLREAIPYFTNRAGISAQFSPAQKRVI